MFSTRKIYINERYEDMIASHDKEKAPNHHGGGSLN